VKIADLHEDIAYAIKTGGYQAEINKRMILDFDRDVEGRHGDLPKYRKAGIKLIFGAIFPSYEVFSEAELTRLRKLYGAWPEIMIPVLSDIKEVIEQVSIYISLVRKFSNALKLIRSHEDLEYLDRSDKIGILMSLEGCDALNKPEDLEILHILGVRSVALTWNYDNRFAASCVSNKDFGLTELGAELIAKANELGIIIDLSHSSKKTALEAAELSKLPVIFSHSNYSKLQNHRRNADDEMIEAIKKTGGVLGFTFIKSTISKEPSLESLAEHIIAVRDEFGIEVLAIGTDLFGIENTPKGLENASKIRDLVSYLEEKGLSKTDIEMLCWNNAMRVIEKHKYKWKIDL